jgi:hypothetical protein
LEDLSNEAEVEVFVRIIAPICRLSFIVHAGSFLFFFGGFSIIGFIKKYYKYPGADMQHLFASHLALRRLGCVPVS